MIARFRAQNSICRNSPMVYHSVITFCRGADAAVALNARCRMARMLVSALLPTFQRRKTLLASVAFLLVFGSTMLVSQPVTAQTENSGHRITITYGGEIIVRFPNYNFYVAGPGHPLTPFRETPNQTRGGAIIWRDQNGSMWDGGSLFISSNYPYKLLQKDRFALRPIGQSAPNPFTMARVNPVQQPPSLYPAVGTNHQQAINQPPPTAGDSFFDLKSKTAKGICKNFEPTSSLPLNVEQELRTVGSQEHLTYRPTATIVVKPYDPATILPPQHDALGTLQR